MIYGFCEDREIDKELWFLHIMSEKDVPDGSAVSIVGDLFSKYDRFEDWLKSLLYFCCIQRGDR